MRMQDDAQKWMVSKIPSFQALREERFVDAEEVGDQKREQDSKASNASGGTGYEIYHRHGGKHHSPRTSIQNVVVVSHHKQRDSACEHTGPCEHQHEEKEKVAAEFPHDLPKQRQSQDQAKRPEHEEKNH